MLNPDRYLLNSLQLPMAQKPNSMPAINKIIIDDACTLVYLTDDENKEYVHITY